MQAPFRVAVTLALLPLVAVPLFGSVPLLGSVPSSNLAAQDDGLTTSERARFKGQFERAKDPEVRAQVLVDWWLAVKDADRQEAQRILDLGLQHDTLALRVRLLERLPIPPADLQVRAVLLSQSAVLMEIREAAHQFSSNPTGPGSKQGFFDALDRAGVRDTGIPRDARVYPPSSAHLLSLALEQPIVAGLAHFADEESRTALTALLVARPSYVRQSEALVEALLAHDSPEAFATVVDHVLACQKQIKKLKPAARKSEKAKAKAQRDAERERKKREKSGNPVDVGASARQILEDMKSRPFLSDDPAELSARLQTTLEATAARIREVAKSKGLSAPPRNLAATSWSSWKAKSIKALVAASDLPSSED